MAFMTAVEQTNIQLLKDLITEKNKYINIDYQNNIGWTALIWASAYGYTEHVRLLLDAGANPDLQTKDGRTAFIYAFIHASGSGNIESMRLLLKAGANTNLYLKNLPYKYCLIAYVHNSKNHIKITKILKRMSIILLLNNLKYKSKIY